MNTRFLFYLYLKVSSWNFGSKLRSINSSTCFHRRWRQDRRWRHRICRVPPGPDLKLGTNRCHSHCTDRRRKWMVLVEKQSIEIKRTVKIICTNLGTRKKRKTRKTRDSWMNLMNLMSLMNQAALFSDVFYFSIALRLFAVQLKTDWCFFFLYFNREFIKKF